MALDYNYYTDTYLGDSVSQEAFPQYLRRAQMAIGALIGWQAVPAQFQELFNEAVCLQIDYYADQGIIIAASGSTEASWTVGKVSVQAGRSSSASAARAVDTIAPGVIAMLERTGLLNPQVPTRDGRWWLF